MNVKKTMAYALTATLMFVSGQALAADAEKGEKTFKKCAVCHSVEPGDKKKKPGPNLAGVVGREAAMVANFKYSSAMKKSGLTWDEATLDKYLTKPKKLVPKTKMVFPGLKKAKDRANVIAYLKSIK